MNGYADNTIVMLIWSLWNSRKLKFKVQLHARFSLAPWIKWCKMWTNSFSKATHLGHRLNWNATQRVNIICVHLRDSQNLLSLGHGFKCSDKQFAHVCLRPIYLCACVSQRIPLTHAFQGWCKKLHTYFVASMKANELWISWGTNANIFLRENLRMKNPETLNSQEKRPPCGHAYCCVNQKRKKSVA